MKRCFRCGELKPFGDFNKAARNRDGLHSYCRECSQAHYRSNRIRHATNVRRAERARRARFREYIGAQLSSGCVDCGLTDIRVLQFDHVRGTKVAAVSSMMRDASFERLQAEIAKCDVRCANCHAVVTYRRRGGSWHDYFAGSRNYPGYIPKVCTPRVTHSDTLLSLLVSSNQLVRIAALAAGNSTPAGQWRTLGILESDGARCA